MPKAMKIDQIMTGHVQKIWGRVLCRTKKPCRWTLSRKGLVKYDEIIHNHKNTSFDSLKPLSDSYSTTWDDLCGKFQGIATHSQREGSCKQKNRNQALNQIGLVPDMCNMSELFWERTNLCDTPC